MAVIIPQDVLTDPQVPEADRLVAAQLADGDQDGWVWYNRPELSDRPRFILLSPAAGVVALEVCDLDPVALRRTRATGIELTDGRTIDPITDSGLRLTELEQRLRDLRPRPEVKGLVALPHWSRELVANCDLSEYFPPGMPLCADEPPPNGAACASELLEAVRARLYPETQFVRSLAPTDPQAEANAARRIALDAEQESIARSLGAGVTVVGGVAGSGKSLVLAARARYLVAEHPDWSVLLLCFNRTLVSYLRELVGPTDGRVTVGTFVSWASSLGVSLPQFNDEEFDLQTRQVIAAAIERGSGVHRYDAVLIDEGQDFHGSWVDLAEAAVRPDGGGVTIAVDGEQTIYPHSLALADPAAARPATADDSAPEAQADAEEVATVFLPRNYRNTAAILRTARWAAFEDDEEAPAALPGVPVQLVWAESWDAQADFIAEGIAWLLSQGERARDIGVLLVTKKGTLKRIGESLAAHSIDYFEVGNRDSKRSFSYTDDTVKVLTVHSAKGMEFRHVFVFGLETLDDKAFGNQQLAYVGMTRAKDSLYLTYKQPNAMLQRARELSGRAEGRAWCEARTYPDDFDWGAD